jgi:hypothetical protein
MKTMYWILAGFAVLFSLLCVAQGLYEVGGLFLIVLVPAVAYGGYWLLKNKLGVL